MLCYHGAPVAAIAASTEPRIPVANTRSAIKRVRQNVRRVAVNMPRRTAAKTFVAKAIRTASGGATDAAAEALAEAMSALDRAAKAGAIHPNAAARRKSRLARKVNAALGGVAVEATARTRATGKAAAAKAARARVAASRARQEAGPKTAAGKARVALAKTTATGAKSTGAGEAIKTTPASKPRTAAKGSSPAKTGAPAKAAVGTARRSARAGTRKSAGGAGS